MSRQAYLESLPVPEYDPSVNNHMRLVTGEINSKEFVAIVKDKVDRRMGLGRYKEQQENIVTDAEQISSKRPGIIRRLGNAMLDGFNPYPGDYHF